MLSDMSRMPPRSIDGRFMAAWCRHLKVPITRAAAGADDVFIIYMLDVSFEFVPWYRSVFISSELRGGSRWWGIAIEA